MLALGNATGFLDAARNDSSGALRAICLPNARLGRWCIEGLSVMSGEVEASLTIGCFEQLEIPPLRSE
jgi:hypothetical protein